MPFLSVLKVDIKADLFHHKKKNSNIRECYKLKVILTWPYFGPEIAVYKEQIHKFWQNFSSCR